MGQGLHGGWEGAAYPGYRQEINEIKRESTDLKHLVANLSLEVYRLKKTAVPPLEGYNGDGA